MKTGTQQITEERQRQIKKEGWTAEHDNQHEQGELGLAAMGYVIAEVMQVTGQSNYVHIPPGVWPWDIKWWKPKDKISNLVRAGALIAAEIDRLQRLEHKDGVK